jgi:hypothetical protein
MRRNERTFGLISMSLAAPIAATILVLALDAAAQTVRFSPGEDAPIALNSATNAYEEGGSFDPLVCAEQTCIELLHNVFEPLVTNSSDQELEACLATKGSSLTRPPFVSNFVKA